MNMFGKYIPKDTLVHSVAQPDLLLLADDKYVLSSTWSFAWTDSTNALLRVVVPQGFTTDIASVPQVFWSLGFTPDGLHRAAALAHDYLYYYHGIVPSGFYQKFNNATQQWEDVLGPDGKTKVWQRDEADNLFKFIMTQAGVNIVKRNLMFWAVHTFGRSLW